MLRPSRTALVVLVVVAALVAVAGVGSAVAEFSESDGVETSQPDLVPVTNSTNYLSPPTDNVTREEYKTARVDVAGAIASDATQLQGEQQIHRFNHSLSEDGSSVAARETVTAIETDLTTLNRDQERLFQQYSDGEMPTRTLIRELVRLESTANQYRLLVDHINEETSLTGPLRTRHANLNAGTSFLPAPLSETLSATVSGTTDPNTVYVQSSNESLVLATIEGDRYVRQATALSQRNDTAEDQFVLDPDPEAQAAFNRAQVLYPWVAENVLEPDIQGFGNSSVYLFRADHPHGELRAYLDGGTTNVFQENQWKDPLAEPVDSIVESTDDNLRLVVHPTSPTGPMLVQLISVGDVAPSSVEIEINGQHVDRIDAGEQLWTVQPLDSFQVTATAPTGESVSVTVLN